MSTDKSKNSSKNGKEINNIGKKGHAAPGNSRVVYERRSGIGENPPPTSNKPKFGKGNK